MIETGYSDISENHIHIQLICKCCGKYLGNYDIEYEKEYNDIKEWNFCPYCGRELEPEE